MLRLHDISDGEFERRIRFLESKLQEVVLSNGGMSDDWAEALARTLQSWDEAQTSGGGESDEEYDHGGDTFIAYLSREQIEQLLRDEAGDENLRPLGR